MPQYGPPHSRGRPTRGEGRLETTAAQGHVERADKYTLCVVLFAMTLFFAGISRRLRAWRAQVAILGLGCIVFL
jgi:hypothetical protein